MQLVDKGSTGNMNHVNRSARHQIDAVFALNPCCVHRLLPVGQFPVGQFAVKKMLVSVRLG